MISLYWGKVYKEIDILYYETIIIIILGNDIVECLDLVCLFLYISTAVENEYLSRMVFIKDSINL